MTPLFDVVLAPADHPNPLSHPDPPQIVLQHVTKSLERLVVQIDNGERAVFLPGAVDGVDKLVSRPRVKDVEEVLPGGGVDPQGLGEGLELRGLLVCQGRGFQGDCTRSRRSCDSDGLGEGRRGEANNILWRALRAKRWRCFAREQQITHKL